MDWFTIAVIVASAIFVALPPRLDPAVQLKEFNEEWARRLQERRR